jgi:diguanylate cyclase (GGDEF)-like protein
MATDKQLSDVLSEFARTLVTDYPIQAILDRLVERIVEIMPVTAAGVTLMSTADDRPRYVAASNAAALRFERLQTTLAEGPCVAAFCSDAAVSLPDLRGDARFRTFGPEALRSGLAAVFAFPLRHGGHNAIGALDLYRDQPGPLDAAGLHAAQTMADVTAAYILNAQTRDDLREASDRFQESSLHDALTGLPNRALFDQLLQHAVGRTRRSGRQLAVMFADLDRFKDVNDLYGHQVGDELLVAVAERLSGLVRPGDVLARLAGDEFVILCENLDDASQVERLASRIDAGMNAPFAVSDQELHVTASVGIAFSGPGKDLPDQILRDADTAMYQAKRRGGARNQVIDLREQERTASQTNLSHDLHGVLSRDEMAMHYQPIVATADGRVSGLEALLRWTHPVRGPIPPPLVIALAEQSHLIADVGRWILEQSCGDRVDWKQFDPTGRGFDIAVNVSPGELLSAGYLPMMAQTVARIGVDPGSVILEVTENVLIADPGRALIVLKELKQVGVRLALDDFGTGYSSLSYLQEFPVDIVKIDRAFVARLGTTPASDMIVAAIVDLAHGLGKSVVAEGMETAAQYQALSALNCDFCQGFYLAKPMPADEVAAYIRRSHVSEPTPTRPATRQ